MKLSEAIRRGLDQTVPGIGGYFMGWHDGKPMACVMGAAWVGARGIEGLTNGECNARSLAVLWPELDQHYDAPETLYFADSTLWGIIAGMNDSEEYTREGIADYIERMGY